LDEAENYRGHQSSFDGIDTSEHPAPPTCNRCEFCRGQVDRSRMSVWVWPQTDDQSGPYS
jgi:hypothetical protein